MYGVEKLYLPQSLEEALALLAPGDVRPLAGGTDVLVKLRHSQEQGVRLLSLSRLPALRRIEQEADGTIVIGAACTFTDLATSPLIARELPLLKTAALAMGGPQIQNVATIGGNVCNGATSADSAPSLLALNAKLVLARQGGSRELPLGDFYAGPGRVYREPQELLTAIRIPGHPAQGWGGVYIKFSTRRAMDISMLGAAAVCQVDEQTRVSRAALALGVAAPTPIRCPEAEALLLGQIPTPALLAEAGALALAAARPRSSWRASREYREALIQTLSARALGQAYARACGQEEGGVAL